MKKESNKTKARCSRDSKKNMLMYIVKLYIFTPMTHNAKFLSAKISEDKSYMYLVSAFGLFVWKMIK